MCHSTLGHHCPIQHYRRGKRKRSVISLHCESHYGYQSGSGWGMGTISYIYLFGHNHSIALSNAGSVHALSIAIAPPLSSIPGHPSTLSSINSINFAPFLFHMHVYSSPNAQHPLPLHFQSSYRFSLVFPNHAISQFQFSIILSHLSTLPTYDSASYSQPLDTEPYIHSPLTFQSLPALIDP